MKKGILAIVLTALLSLVLVKPAYAAELNTYEQKVYDEFVAVVEEYRDMLDKDISWSYADQYESEARGALLKTDLSEAACNEFSQAVKDVRQLLVDNNVKTRTEAKKVLPQALEIVNKVANKYGMKVTVDADIDYAHVTVDGQPVSPDKPGIKQTGFGLAQTAIVTIAALSVLAGAFVVARKKQLFA